MNITVEPSYRVYDDDTGAYYEVRFDRDGLGCVEVVYSEKAGEVTAPGPMPPEMAVAIADCLIKLAKFRQDHPL